MSKAKRHQHRDPTAGQLLEHVERLPRQLGIWRAGQHGLYHLLLGSSLARLMDQARARITGGDVAVTESAEAWQHATSALIEWHSQWARPGSGEPLQQDVAAAIRCARDWRALEVILHGLGSGDMYVAETSGWEIRLGNSRDHAAEVLDIVLQQVSIPARSRLAAPPMNAVHDWFADHAGQAEEAHRLPEWVGTITYRRVLADLLSRGLTMPAHTDLGGLTLAEALNWRPSAQPCSSAGKQRSGTRNRTG